MWEHESLSRLSSVTLGEVQGFTVYTTTPAPFHTHFDTSCT